MIMRNSSLSKLRSFSICDNTTEAKFIAEMELLCHIRSEYVHFPFSFLALNDPFIIDTAFCFSFRTFPPSDSLHSREEGVINHFSLKTGLNILSSQVFAPKDT